MMLMKLSLQEVETMQLSYNLIKNGFAKQGESKVISTEYVTKKMAFEKFEENEQEQQE